MDSEDKLTQDRQDYIDTLSPHCGVETKENSYAEAKKKYVELLRKFRLLECDFKELLDVYKEFVEVGGY